jgi:hypothetical protein
MEWFLTFNRDVVIQIIESCNGLNLDSAFIWDETPEGTDYWSEGFTYKHVKRLIEMVEEYDAYYRT